MRKATSLLWLAALMATSGADALNIRRIDLEGFKLVPVAAVRRDFPVKPGQTYDQAEATKGREWLLSMGVFQDVQLTTHEEGQIIDLTYRVTENPEVRAVRVEGNTQIASAALRPSLLTQPKQILNRRSLVVDANVIGQAYVRMGMRVAVEVVLDPPTAGPGTPVLVLYKLTEIKCGQVQLAPLYYVRRDKLGPYIILQPGELLVEQRLVEQAEKLMSCGLLNDIGAPRVGDADANGQAPIAYTTVEHDRPLLDAASLALVDAVRLAQVLRFQAVDVPVERADFDLYLAPAEVQEKLAAAVRQAEAQPDDGEARYQVYAWQRRAGGDALGAAKQALPVLRAAVAKAPTPRLHLRLAQVMDVLEVPEAAAEANLAARDASCRCEAYSLLLNLRLAALGRGDNEGQQLLRQTVVEAAEVVANLAANANLEELTGAYQLYYSALTVSLLDASLRAPLRLDGAAGRRLMGRTQELLRDKVTAVVDRHLGRLVTIVGFAAKVAGPDVAPADTWPDFVELLKYTRQEFLSHDIETTTDPGAWFFLALNDLVRDDAAATRAVALRGLGRQATNERLVDIYVMTCIQSRQSDPARAADLLRASLADVQRRLADGSLSGWGPQLLLAKLQLALRDCLPDNDTAGRERARKAGEEAAQNAVTAQPTQSSGLWILALAQLKGPQPGQAVEPLTKLLSAEPRNREAAYALAVAQLAAGHTEAGLKGMAALRQPAR